MELYIFLASIIIVVCILADKVSSKVGVPTLLLFILLGMVFGSEGLIKINFDNYKLAEQVCSITLIFIMFYGGFGTNWNTAKPVAVKSFILAFFGTVLTAGFVGLFAWKVLNFSMLEGFLIGAVISSTDAASVFSILRSKNLNLKNGLASLLEIESGSNDPASYMMTVIIISLMTGTMNQPVPVMLFCQLFFGIAVGGLIGYGASRILKKKTINFNGLDTLFVVAVAMLAYSFSVLLGGNGFLSVYIAGLIVGNTKFSSKYSLVNFFDSLTALMQILLFFILGLLAIPSEIIGILPTALAIILFLSFVARPLSIFGILTPFKASVKEMLLVSWAGLRGAASIVFAIMVTVSDISTKNDIFHIVFCMALLSVSVQGSLLPFMAKLLNLVDDSESVLKTFSDYQEDTEMELIQVSITEGHDWIGKKLKEISVPPGSIVVMIERGKETIIPNGETKLRYGDTLILNCEKYTTPYDVALNELSVEIGHRWSNQMVKDIDLDGSLIIMIRRENSTLVPKGDTIIRPGDTLIMR